jgi:HAMP domain-containing protein
MHSSLELDGTVIGSLDVVMDVGEVLGVTADTTGLGDTGETIHYSLEPGGRVQVLNALRHAPAPPAEPPPSVTAALAGHGEVFELSHDYRGAEVWAASRRLPELGWGLVVKIDADEELARFYALRSRIIDVALALAAFAVVVGTLLGFRLARPIRDLSDVMDRVRKGETELRAEVHGEDEVAVLARALNDWLDDMEARSPHEPAGAPGPHGR